MNSKGLGIGGLVLVAMLGLLFWLSPFWAASGLAVAAYDGETFLLEDYVDFPRLRESVKGEVLGEMVETVTASTSNNFEALGAALGMSIADRMIDQLLTPAGLVGMLKNSILVEGAERPSRPAVMIRLIRDKLLTWRSSSVVYLGDGGIDGPQFVLRREGVAWRLVGVDRIASPSIGASAPRARDRIADVSAEIKEIEGLLARKQYAEAYGRAHALRSRSDLSRADEKRVADLAATAWSENSARN